MEFNVSVHSPWQDYPAYVELWSGTRVFCVRLEDGAACEPFEHAGLALIPIPLRQRPKGFEITYRGQFVASFAVAPKWMGVRLYLMLPTSPTDPNLIPHRVADAVVVPHEPASPLFSHADHTWCDVQEYGLAQLGTVQGRLPLLSAPMRAEMARNLHIMFDRVNGPDLLWIINNVDRMLPSVRDIAATFAYQAVSGAPLLTEKECAAGMYRRQGSSSASMWRLSRGQGVPPCSDEWIEERVVEALHLRPAKSREHWWAEKAFWDQEHRGREAEFPLTEDRQEQFMVVAHVCFERDLHPHGAKRHHQVMHNWAKEALEDVFHALGAWVATRRYVYDHRWIGGNKYEQNTDEHTPGFTIPGDCEDTNSTLYFLHLYIIQRAFPGSALLRAVKLCLLAAGVPCMVIGSSQSPTMGYSGGRYGAHSFGFAIPHRIFARMVWGPDVDDAAICKHVGISRWAYETMYPHIYETICPTSAAYMDNLVWRNDEDRKRFSAFHLLARKMGQNPVLPDAVGAYYPLSLTRDGAHGYMMHDAIVRLYTAAIATCFPPAVQSLPSLEIDPTGVARQATRSLEYTYCFFPVKGNEICMPITALHVQYPEYRLVSGTRLSAAEDAADAALCKWERPFVPLRAIGQRAWVLRFADMISRKIPLVHEPNEMQADRFVMYVHGDRLEQAFDLCVAHARETGAVSAVVRPFCWDAALILNY